MRIPSMKWGALLVLFAACGSGSDGGNADANALAEAGGASAANASRSGGAMDPEDPCRLVTRAEAETVVGTLRADPWRSGATCHFDAADGQRLDVEAQFSGAQALAKITGVVDQVAAKGLIVNTGRGLDTLEGRWDDAKWQLGDYLVARLGDRSVTVYTGNTLSHDVATAAQIADLALGRLDAPIDYNGGAHQEPAPLAAPRNPCTLLTRDEVEAAAGPVTGEPVADDDRNCTWTLAPKGGRTRQFSYSLTWKDGIQEFNQDAAALGLFKSNLQDPVTANAGGANAMDEMMKNPDAQKALGALKGLMGGKGMETGGSLMPKSDPDVKGPWARGALLAGSDLVVVQKGVRIRAGVGAVGYEATKQLVGKVAGRL